MLLPPDPIATQPVVLPLRSPPTRISAYRFSQHMGRSGCHATDGGFSCGV